MSHDDEIEDLYELLELSKGKKSSVEEIKRAYKKLALRFHPDKAKTDDEREESTEKFQKISFAYSILSDEKLKEAYDTTGRVDSNARDAKDWKEYFDGNPFYTRHVVIT